MNLRLLFSLATACVVGLSACTSDETALEPAADTTPGAAASRHDHGTESADVSFATNPFSSGSGTTGTTARTGGTEAGEGGSSKPDAAPRRSAAGADAPAVAVISASANGFTLEPAETNYEALHVTIAGPNGINLEKHFKAGDATQIDQSLPDGTYSWQAVTQPSVPAWAREKMRAVRESGDANAERRLISELRSQGALPTEEQARNNVTSGTLTIRNGVMVVPQAGDSRQDKAG